MRITEIIPLLNKVQKTSNGYDACCPAHNDNSPSLGISEGEDGRVLLRCRSKGCSTEAICESLGITIRDLFPPRMSTPPRRKRRIEATYDYTDEQGNVLYQKVRYVPKDFTIRSPDGNEGWESGLKGSARVLYRLPEVLEMKKLGKPILLVEGEKDADALRSIRLTATCNIEGAISKKADGTYAKWHESYTDALSGMHIVVVADKDEPGRQHAKHLLTILGDKCDVKVIEFPDIGETPVKDAADWIAAGGTREDFAQIYNTAPDWTPPPDKPEDQTIDPKDYFGTARLFANEKFMCGDVLGLLHHDTDYLRYTGTHYAEEDPATIRSSMWQWLDNQHIKLEDGGTARYQPNTNSVNNRLDALKAITNLPSTVKPPAWIHGGQGPSASEMIAFKNTLMHLKSGDKIKHTPRLFIRNSLPFDYDPNAPAPMWNEFLNQLWPNTPDCIETLQKMFGYLIAGDTHLQKIFMLIGVKRSGKGTIAYILSELLGPDSVCGPTMLGLVSQFGLQPLIGKSLAVIGDARLSGKEDQAPIVERLLTVSGEDIVSVPRKNKQDWVGQLPTRFLLLSNLLPRLSDASGALSSRMILLETKACFLGREDYGLRLRLRSELPGIANWAVEGWRKLQEAGHIENPESSKEQFQELCDLSSPVSGFVRERCELDPQSEVSRAELYDAWCEYCRKEGNTHVTNLPTFGRDIHAAFPNIGTVRKNNASGERTRYYTGIRLPIRIDDKTSI